MGQLEMEEELCGELIGIGEIKLAQEKEIAKKITAEEKLTNEGLLVVQQNAENTVYPTKNENQILSNITKKIQIINDKADLATEKFELLENKTRCIDLERNNFKEIIENIKEYSIILEKHSNRERCSDNVNMRMKLDKTVSDLEEVVIEL